MTAPNTITMTMRELDKLKVIQAVVDGHLMVWKAAERLALSRRQIERMVVRYRAESAAGLISKRTGRPSNNLVSMPGLKIEGLLVCGTNMN